jgi:DNA-binding beta-propeller fold protein YncE
MRRRLAGRLLSTGIGIAAIAAILAGLASTLATLAGQSGAGGSKSIYFSAPAGTLPTTRSINIDGYNAAVLPNGRLVTPVGVEVALNAPKPYGMALSPDGTILATINSGASRFSISLVRNLQSAAPSVTRVDMNATFMGIAFSADGSRFFASGGENGNIWVGETATNRIIGSVNLNGPLHPLPAPLTVTSDPPGRFKGTFPGNMTLAPDGRYLYVVDQGSFGVFVIDTTNIVTGVNGSNQLTQPNNFAAVVGRVAAGRYPYALTMSDQGDKLFVANVGVFQYRHLRPSVPTGNANKDYPLGYPGAGYPEETETDRTIKIKKVDPRNLPDTLRDPEGIRVGYIDQDIDYVLPGLGSPNVPQASSVYVFNTGQQPTAPPLTKSIKTGLLVGEVDRGIKTFSGSHPNAVAVGREAIYVSNGNNDSVSILHPATYEELHRVSLDVFRGADAHLKGIQPVALALSPDGDFLYVAEAGINAVAVLRLQGKSAQVLGHIPVGWWPSSVQVSADGRRLYVANARGRGAGPDDSVPPDNLGSPKRSTMGSISIVPVPNSQLLEVWTRRVLANNGLVQKELLDGDPNNPIPVKAGQPSSQIKHIIFLNKENSTHDQMLGDIVATRRGVPVAGEPSYSLGYDASPNHHELALAYSFSDNFYLEPAVSSDGHRWLTNTYTTEFEETHWPASYGGQRRDAGDDPNVFGSYPGRLGFTDANGSPDPHDYNQHGSIFLHLYRHGQPFVNFGNGFEFAQVDEDADTEPTGIRQHVNVPMEKVLRDNSDHLFPEYNTHIPDSPLVNDPQRFNRFGRFKQVFESHYVDRQNGVCMLPAYVDLFYPNDHGGGAFDINPSGPAWSYKRFVQDNDAALGLTVELISNSPCWKDTVIFVVEDDPQNGLDHVDGYRSIFLAISPWVKREYVSKQHTSLASIFKTVNLILGLPPLNQYDAAATDLRDMFTSTPDFRPYTMTPILWAGQASAEWIAATKAIDFSRPDADEVKLRAAILQSEGLPRRTSPPQPNTQK